MNIIPISWSCVAWLKLQYLKAKKLIPTSAVATKVALIYLLKIETLYANR